MPDLDRTTVILSIRPVYVERILIGDKNIEWRRKPLPDQVKRVLMWRTSTPLFEGHIAGMFEIDFTATATAGSHLVSIRQYPHLKAGIDDEALIKYAGGPGGQLTAIVFGAEDPVRFSGYNRLGLSAGPQSFQYAPADWWERLGLTRPGDLPSVWDASCAPGGMVCSGCGMPTEPEPCREHQPRAWEAMK